jgi:hypothetical protein
LFLSSRAVSQSFGCSRWFSFSRRFLSAWLKKLREIERLLTLQQFSNNLRHMRKIRLVPIVVVTMLAAAFPALAELQTGPALPYHVVRDWAQLPAGWNFGEVSAVDVDKNDNVWVFNRGPHPVIQFDRLGKMLQPWPEQ